MFASIRMHLLMAHFFRVLFSLTITIYLQTVVGYAFNFSFLFFQSAHLHIVIFM